METELRRRAEARGLDVGSSLPEGATSWVSCLLKRNRRDAQMRQFSLAAGQGYSMFVDKGGRLLTCGCDLAGRAPHLGHAVDPDADPTVRREIGPPTPVPSMQNRRVVSVATGVNHSLALSTEGEVYSWGNGQFGALGHGDVAERTVPCMIESLSRIERIAAGSNSTSAAVDKNGRLFTWGRASVELTEDDWDEELDEFEGPSGLGYELDAEAKYQAISKRVDALSQERVVSVALGDGFTLAVTDAGAVFSFGSNRVGVLGHSSFVQHQVLPRRIDALVETGRPFVAVAAGNLHALALTEEGELYGWGDEIANGLTPCRAECKPRRVAALIGQRVKLMHARDGASSAVTEKGELFTWGSGYEGPQFTPTRVAGLSGVVVAAVAIGSTHTLAADADGVVWVFGQRSALGLDASCAGENVVLLTPTPIPTLRVRVLNSP